MHGLCAPTLLFLATKNSLFLFSLQDSLSSHFLSTCGSLSQHSSYHPPATSFLLRGILTKSTREQAHGHSIPWASMSPLSWFTDFSLPHTIFFFSSYTLFTPQFSVCTGRELETHRDGLIKHLFLWHLFTHMDWRFATGWDLTSSLHDWWEVEVGQEKNMTPGEGGILLVIMN